MKIFRKFYGEGGDKNLPDSALSYSVDAPLVAVCS